MYSLGGQAAQLESRVFDMVHSKTCDDVKEHILDSLMDPKALPRVVIATKVIGMGLDVDCEMVVHYGPPSNIDDYIQHIGRAGRSGRQAHAVLLYSGKQLRNVDSSILGLVKNTENMCLRALCLKDFNTSQSSPVEPRHLCCGVCTHTCCCASCANSYNPYELHLAKQSGSEEEDEEEEFCRTVSDNDKRLLQAGTNFCFKKCVAVIAMQLEDCIALSAVCVAVSFCMLWGLKRERPATDHTIMKNANANIQYFAVLMTA